MFFAQYVAYGIDSLHREGKGVTMTKEQLAGLNYLLEQARKVKMSDEEAAEQRRSFAYGNAAFENADITKEMIEAEDRKLHAGR